MFIYTCLICLVAAGLAFALPRPLSIVSVPLALIGTLCGLLGVILSVVAALRDMPKPSESPTLYGCLTIILLFLLALGYAMFAPSIRRANEFARRAKCGENLKTIHSAIEAYRQSHSGEYPPTLRSLVEAGLLDAERLHCPGTPADSGIGYDYFPPGGSSTQPATQPHVLASDRKGNHEWRKSNEGRNVLYVSGLVTWVSAPPDEWENPRP
ncbi:MAG: hypothetical protein BWX88_01363 [Planctomycetes bacterium ADurb.Bin126]|nr:MAG: hypothetical protein BWX88_01363 [Planctomycetes bacterium ADurb.Bin126]HOD84233.1 hypothetical protein [Phycisphaerae bacterium]HQL72331.1 hypothetical protein [Phycisphaerae bacterium]